MAVAAIRRQAETTRIVSRSAVRVEVAALVWTRHALVEAELIVVTGAETVRIVLIDEPVGVVVQAVAARSGLSTAGNGLAVVIAT